MYMFEIYNRASLTHDDSVDQIIGMQFNCLRPHQESIHLHCHMI